MSISNSATTHVPGEIGEFSRKRRTFAAGVSASARSPFDFERYFFGWGREAGGTILFNR